MKVARYFFIMERQIKGIWIPIEIWENSELAWNEKILLMEVDSFTKQDIDCYITDEYIGNLLNVTERQASRYINKLIKLGYVIKTKFDGRKRYVKSAIKYDVVADTTKMSEQPRQKCRSNNINIINKEINKEKSIEDRKRDFGMSLEPYQDRYPREMLQGFYHYWTEYDNDQNPKYMKFELTKKKGGTFSVSGRLATWARNNKGKIDTPAKKKEIWETMGLTKEQYLELK